ncbi:MAG TPA: uracil-DNA glycosylase [Bacteroidia bacterium]
MQEKSPQIEEGWLHALKDEFKKDYFLKLKAFLTEEKKQYRLFPPGNHIFNAFNLTSFHNVKVVILGQDPYHGFGQAHGLCFSVPDGVKAPPSLKNIFKEIKDDVGIDIPPTGNLSPWARQGVLLLNATLTVRENQAGSHQNKGWEVFTDAVIKKLSDEKTGLVFLLWGNYAKQKAALIDVQKHHVLTAPHPSPLARGGFFGCKHFSKTNEFLKQQGQMPINWKLV